jgi:tetratricopeptide (TPR) repeat protein
MFAGPLEAQCPNGSEPPCLARGPADTNAIVVLPFAVRGPPEVQYLRESMVDLLHMALDGVGRVSVRYPQTALRRLGQLTDPTDLTTAAPVVRGMGAGRAIGGSVVVSGNELRIRIDVYDAVRGRSQFPVEGRGTLDQLGSTVDGLAAAILARKVVPAERAGRIDLSEYAKSTGALQSFLVAMQHVRRAERKVAGDSLRSALRQDPNFGLAYYWLGHVEGAQAGAGGVEGGVPAIVRAANARSDSFPERVRFMLSIMTANQAGERARVLALVHEAVRRYPNDADAAYQRADKHFHLGLNTGVPRDRVLAMFRRAIEMDDENPELLDHYTTLMNESGDTTAYLAAAKRCRAIAPQLCNGEGFRILHHGERPWATRPADSVSQPFVFLTRGAPNLAYSLVATDSMYLVHSQLSRPSGLRFQAYTTRAVVELERGRFVKARSLIDSAAPLAGNSRAHDGLALLADIMAGAGDPQVAMALGRLTTTNNIAFAGVRAWHATVRMPADSAEKAIRLLEGRAWPDSAIGSAMATGLRGILALRQGDTTQAMRMLAAASNNHMRRIFNRNFWPGAWLSLTAARIEAARGNRESARIYLADMYPAPDAMPWLTEGEELRGRVALALGDTASAKAAYRNVVEIWKDADQVLQPRVAAAREALARLERR